MKIILAVLLTVSSSLISFNSFGQFGFKGGYLRSAWTPPSETKGYNGYSVGVFYSFKLKNFLYFQVETNYVNKGFKSQDIFANNSANTSSRPYRNHSFTMLEVPLLIKAQFGQKIKPYIMTGFSPNFSTQFSSQYYSIYYSIIGAGGISIPVKKNFIIAEARISQDIITSIRYRCIGLYTGFMF